MTRSLNARTAGEHSSKSANWSLALSRLWPIPSEYRDASVDRVAALDMLRCGEHVLDELVSAGLPVSEGAGGQCFDRYDLFNLALASGSGVSVPERAIRYALRWMSSDPPSWIERLRWSFDIELECPDPEHCEPEATWSHARLEPDAGGGELLEFSTRPDDFSAVGNRLWFEGRGPVQLSGTLVTRGQRMKLVSPRLNAIVDDFLAAGYTWARMPERLQRDYERVIEAGVGPCISASLFLQREFERAGFRAVTRRGWLLGMLDLAHSWIEVVDDDGETKVVDPIFRRLVEHAERAHPDLAVAAIGSRFNRLLSAAIPADAEMVTHACRGRVQTPVRRTVIRRMTR